MALYRVCFWFLSVVDELLSKIENICKKMYFIFNPSTCLNYIKQISKNENIIIEINSLTHK